MSRLQLSLNSLDTLVQIIHQVLLMLINWVGSGSEESGWILFLLLLEVS